MEAAAAPRGDPWLGNADAWGAAGEAEVDDDSDAWAWQSCQADDSGSAEPAAWFGDSWGAGDASGAADAFPQESPADWAFDDFTPPASSSGAKAEAPAAAATGRGHRWE